MITRVISCLVLSIACAACTRDQQCHMRQKEARADLFALNDAQAKFHESHGRFARSFEELNFATPDQNYYDVSIESASADAYTAKALGKRNVKGDEWTINQLGNPVMRTSACP